MGISRFLEKVGLAVVAGALTMFVGTTPAPELQAVVAGVACPAGTTASAVVRYPHVVEPAEMVRNTPLVCVVEGQAQLASTWRVLPSLFVLGFAVGLVVLVVVGRLVRTVRAAGSDPPAPPRSAVDTMRWLPLLIAAPQVVLTAFGAYWWLAVDTPYRVTGCRSSSGAGATCYDGEPTYRMLTFLFGGLALAGLVVWAVMVKKSTTRRRRFRRAVADAVWAPAVLVGADATNTKINGGRVYRYTYEIAPEDGTPPFRFTERGRGSPAGSVGGRTLVLYERGDPTNAFTSVSRSTIDEPTAADPSPLISR